MALATNSLSLYSPKRQTPVQLDNAHAALEQADTLAQTYAKKTASASSRLESYEKDAARTAAKLAAALEQAACAQRAEEKRDELADEIKQAQEEKRALQIEVEETRAKFQAMSVRACAPALVKF
jgi:chromosome segregation ATPase